MIGIVMGTLIADVSALGLSKDVFDLQVWGW